MFDNGGGAAKPGVVTVKTTSHTGLSIEHWADRCVEKIIYVSPVGTSIIKDQAEAYRENIRKVLTHYIAQAIKSDRTTLYNLFLRQGHQDMAEILRKL
jgi:uncharacterized protein CbrC (UPF0167 family)